MIHHRSYPCTFLKACNILWLVNVQHVSQTQAALTVGLNIGTVNHIVHKRRFSNAYPIPIKIAA